MNATLARATEPQADKNRKLSVEHGKHTSYRREEGRAGETPARPSGLRYEPSGVGRDTPTHTKGKYVNRARRGKTNARKICATNRSDRNAKAIVVTVSRVR